MLFKKMNSVYPQRKINKRAVIMIMQFVETQKRHSRYERIFLKKRNFNVPYAFRRKGHGSVYSIIETERGGEKLKRKSDKTKLAEGRCLGGGDQYIGFIKANEIGSIGTSSAVYDPIAGRTVDTLSMGEKEFFWLMRYRDDVELIQEQMMLSSDTVRKICEEHGFRIPRNRLSTDFLITFRDGSRVAYSVKSGSDDFTPDSPKYGKILIRQYVELEYWKRYGVDFKIVLRENLNKTLAANIEHCMAYYDSAHVTGTETMLKYLVAHKAVSIPMDGEIVRFASLVRGNEDQIREAFRRYHDGR